MLTVKLTQKRVDLPPRYWARARREPAMLGIRNGCQPRLDNTSSRPFGPSVVAPATVCGTSGFKPSRWSPKTICIPLSLEQLATLLYSSLLGSVLGYVPLRPPAVPNSRVRRVSEPGSLVSSYHTIARALYSGGGPPHDFHELSSVGTASSTRLRQRTSIAAGPMLPANRVRDEVPADVYFGRGHTILLERERIKRKTIEHRRLQHRDAAA